MGNRSEQELRHRTELRQRCDEVLHYMWDPIGVAGNPGARDEYDSYLPRIFELVVGEASMSDIGAYLTEVESGSMGLRNDTERALQVAETLLDWREWIYDRAS